MAEDSEFSWGLGLMPPQGRGYVPTAYDRLRATRLTDPANPDANEDDVLGPNVSQSTTDSDGLYVAGSQRSGTTPMVQETGPASSGGQHAIIDPARYNPGHDPEGMQDGAGQAWRDSIPSTPVELPDPLTND